MGIFDKKECKEDLMIALGAAGMAYALELFTEYEHDKCQELIIIKWSVKDL